MPKKYEIMWRILDYEADEETLKTLDRVTDIIWASITLEFVRAGLPAPLVEAFNPVEQEEE